MTFGLSGAALAGVAIGGATLVSGYMGQKAAGKAADAQSAASEAGIAEQQRQFEAIQKLLNPYVQGGYKGLAGQMDLLGTNGAGAQQTAIDALKGSPQFTSLLAQGENSILANASATGGLRGGNTQAALAQFSPALLAQTIEQQYGRLGGLSSMGQNAAAGVGNAGMNTGNQISALLQQQGAAQAGGYLAQGKAWSSIPSAIGSGMGLFNGLGGKF